MSKPKVCQVSSVHFAIDTRIFYRLAQSLKTEYEVTVIGVHPKEEILDGIKIIPFRRFKNKMLRVLVTWFLILRKCLKAKADIYQIHDPELIPTALILKALGKQVVYDVHENIADDIFDKPWIKNKKLLYWMFTFFEKRVAKSCPIFIAEDSYLPRYKSLTNNVHIVHNYPNKSFFDNYIISNRVNEPRLFYSGILLFSRAIMETIEAMYLLQQKNVFVHFDVIGELYTDMDAAIDALPYINEVKPYLHFHGRLPLNESYEISEKAKIGLSLIHPMKNSRESYPTKIFEYMCIGLPQIASDFPLYKSVVESNNCGITCNPQSPEAIASSIEKYLISDKLYMEHANNAISKAIKYQWETEFVKVQEVYSDLLS